MIKHNPEIKNNMSKEQKKKKGKIRIHRMIMMHILLKNRIEKYDLNKINIFLYKCKCCLYIYIILIC